jgi:cysteine desulfurase
LSFPGHSGESILHRLDLQGICISTGSACNSKDTVVSHVLKAIGLPDDIAQSTVRISLGKYNSEDEIISIVESLSKL